MEDRSSQSWEYQLSDVHPEYKKKNWYEWSAQSLVDTLLILLSDDAACGPRRMALFSDAKRCVRIILSPQRRVIKSGRAFVFFFWATVGGWMDVGESARVDQRCEDIHLTFLQQEQRRSYIFI
jgi:hypothetical protein